MIYQILHLMIQRYHFEDTVVVVQVVHVATVPA